MYTVAFKYYGIINVGSVYMSEDKIMELMNKISYGWVDKNGKQHIDDYETFSSDYILQSPDQLMISKVGVCWDQVELQREYFKDYQSVRTYFIVYYDGNKCPTHTFLTYKKGDSYYWFEHAWERFKGFHKYDTMKDLLNDIRGIFISNELNDKCDGGNLVTYEYSKPKYNISVDEFYRHCESGRIIE